MQRCALGIRKRMACVAQRQRRKSKKPRQRSARLPLSCHPSFRRLPTSSLVCSQPTPSRPLATKTRYIDPLQAFLQVDDVHAAVGADAAESCVSRRLPAVRSIWSRRRTNLDPDADSRISARFGDYRVGPYRPDPRGRTEHLSVGRDAHEGSRGQKCGTDPEPKSRRDLAMFRHICTLMIPILLGAPCVRTARTRPSRCHDPLVMMDT